MGFNYYDSDTLNHSDDHGLIIGFNYYDRDILAHHGILGMKWGVRRYQNPDGSLTDAGRKRLEKYKTRASNYRKSEAKNKYGRLQTEIEGKSNGEAHRIYSKFEVSDRKHAEKYEKKAKRLEQLENGKSQQDLANEIVKNANANKSLAKIPQIKRAIAKLNDVAEQHKKSEEEYYKSINDWYHGNNPAYDEYTRRYANQLVKKYGGSKERWLDLIRNDDMDQGHSYQMYLNDHPKEKQRHDALLKAYDDAAKKHYAAITSTTEQLLGKYGESTKWVTNIGDHKYTVSARIRLNGLLYAESMKKRK